MTPPLPSVAIDELLAEEQAAAMRGRFDVAAWAEGARIFITAPEWARLWQAVWADETLNAIGRGYYLNGNRNVVVVPVCDRCKLELYLHGSSVAGAACDLDAATADLWRAIAEETPLGKLFAWLALRRWARWRWHRSVRRGWIRFYSQWWRS